VELRYREHPKGISSRDGGKDYRVGLDRICRVFNFPHNLTIYDIQITGHFTSSLFKLTKKLVMVFGDTI